MLSACQPRPPADDWFPLLPGTEQRYAVRVQADDDGDPRPDETWTLRTEGPRPWGEAQLMTRWHDTGVRYYLQQDDQGVRRVAHQTELDPEPLADEPPQWVLKAPYTVGTEWTTRTVPYLIERNNEYPRDLRHDHPLPMQWRIEAVDDRVTLASGETLSPCLRVEGVAVLNLYVNPVKGFTDVLLTSREWYCRGHGLVRLERDEHVPGGFFTGGRLVAEVAL